MRRSPEAASDAARRTRRREAVGRPWFAGAQLQAHFRVSVVIDGVELNMTVMSYRDHVDFGIITDRDQVDDAWALVDRTAAALDELETAVCGKRATAKKRRRPSARTPA